MLQYLRADNMAVEGFTRKLLHDHAATNNKLEGGGGERGASQAYFCTSRKK